MKNIFIFLITTTLLLSCKTEPKDYAEVTGKIENINEKKLITIFNRLGFKKEISVNEDGTFSDTLKVTEGRYTFTDGGQYGRIYLKNDSEIEFTVDAENFYKTLKFSGDISDKNNFMADYIRLQDDYLSEDIFDGDEASFDKVFNNLNTEFEALKEKSSSIDSTFFAEDNKDFEMMRNQYKSYHNSKLALRKEFPAGMKSPVFENYENFVGGTTSLQNLKGKYVYIDVWATWCGPCKREIPALKEIEKKYHDKNIEFVSISVDNGRGYQADSREAAFIAAKEGWKTMVAEKELGGIQLFSDKAFQSDFITAYKINAIPRFLLIDPDGNIVSADAPRPSSESLTKLFDSLGI